MISLMVKLALCLLVLFVVVPGVLIFALVVREMIRENRKLLEWYYTDEPEKLAG